MLIRRGWKGSRPPQGPYGINYKSLQAAGLAAWFPSLGWNGTGGVVDILGGLTGTPVNVVGRPEPTLGQVWQLNGSTAYIRLDALSPLAVALGRYTLTLWARSDVDGATSPEIFSQHTSGGANLNLHFMNTSEVLSISPAISGMTNTGTILLNTGTRGQGWHHFAFYYDNTGASFATLLGFVDAIQEVNSLQMNKITTSSLWSIGQEWDTATPSNFWDGDVADIRLYAGFPGVEALAHMVAPETMFDLYLPTLPQVWSLPIPSGSGGTTGIIIGSPAATLAPSTVYSPPTNLVVSPSAATLVTASTGPTVLSGNITVPSKVASLVTATGGPALVVNPTPASLRASSQGPTLLVSMWRFPTTDNNNWLNTDALYADDGDYCYFALPYNTQRRLRLIDFGWDAVIPTFAQVRQALIEAEWFVDVNTSTVMITMQGAKGTSAYGPLLVDESEPLTPTVFQVELFGATRADILDSVDFEVWVTGLRSDSANPVTVNLDYVRMWVQWELPYIPEPAQVVASTSGPTVVVPPLIAGGLPARVVASTFGPTVVNGSQTITPAPISLVPGVSGPGVALGSLELTLDAASLVPGIENPTVVQSSLTLLPEVAGAVARVAGPGAVVYGSLTLSLQAGDAMVDTRNPAVRLGSLSLTLGAASLLTSALDGTTILGSITLTRSASLILATPAPSVRFGSTTAIPSAAALITETVLEAVEQGSMSITPGFASMILQTPAGLAILGSLIFRGLPARSLVAQTAGPAVVTAGSVSLTPAQAALIVVATGGLITLGSLQVGPAPSETVLGRSGPVVILGGVSVGAQAILQPVTAGPVVVMGAQVVSPAPASARVTIGIGQVEANYRRGQAVGQVSEPYTVTTLVTAFHVDVVVDSPYTIDVIVEE